MLEEEALVTESTRVEWCICDNGSNLRALVTERGLSCNHIEQNSLCRNVLKLRVEFHFVPIRVDLPLAIVAPTRPERCSIGTCIFKPEVEREMYIIIFNKTASSLLSELGEFRESQIVDPSILFEESLLDSFLGALVREQVDVDSEVILKEVETIGRLESHVSQHVDGVHSIASELHGQRWVQPRNLGEIEPAL